MQKIWVMLAVGVVGCAGTSTSEPLAETSGTEQVAGEPTSTTEATTQPETEVADASQTSEGAPKEESVASKTAPEGYSCTPNPEAETKLAADKEEASEVADPDRPLRFEVGALIIEFPACTKEATTGVITTTLVHENRPTSSHIHPDFTRHGHTVNLDQAIPAPEGSSIIVGMHASREFVKRGKKFMLAVEHPGPCEGPAKRDPMESGECSHWKLYDASFDAERKAMVAEIDRSGGYRLQFGWMPEK